MVADERRVQVFGVAGTMLREAERQSATGMGYPVVTDIGNDGSAEIFR